MRIYLANLLLICGAILIGCVPADKLKQASEALNCEGEACEEDQGEESSESSNSSSAAPDFSLSHGSDTGFTGSSGDGSSSSPKTFTFGQHDADASVTLSLSNDDNADLSVSCPDLPSWISFNATSLQLTVSSDYAGVGTTTNFRCVTSDSAGTSSSTFYMAVAVTAADSLQFNGPVANEQIGLLGTKLVDMNLDGNLDLVAVSDDLGSEYKVYIQFGKGSRDFDATSTITADGTNAVTLTLSSTSPNLSFRTIDANGDGNLDISLRTYGTNCLGGTTGYVVFAKSGTWPADTALPGDLDGTNGHYMSLQACRDQYYADIDNDGYLDIVAEQTWNTSGTDSYVKWGTSTPFPANVNITSADYTTIVDDVTGVSFSRMKIGDITGDGIPEIIMRASQTGAYHYILKGGHSMWGSSGSRPATINLSTIPDGDRGTYLYPGGSYSYDAMLHDLNGDGILDYLFGTSYSVSTGGSAGAMFVFFGRSSALSANYTSLAADSLIAIEGHWASSYQNMGSVIYEPHDFNNNGYKDILVRSKTSLNYFLVFGRASWPSMIRAIDLDGTASFGTRIDAPTSESKLGLVGDFNNDGMYDFFLADSTDASGGSAWAWFGKSSGYGASTDISTPSGSDGFKISGSNDSTQALGKTAAVGDIDGDGIDDVVLAAPTGDGAASDSGVLQIIFGSTSAFSATIVK